MMESGNANFEIQDPVRVIDELEARRNKNKPRTITSRKGLAIVAVSLIGVVAIAGIAVAGVAASSSSPSVDDVVVPVEKKDTFNQNIYPARLVNSLHNKAEDLPETHPEEPTPVKEVQQQQVEVPRLKPKDDVAVCKTVGCTLSAQNLRSAMDETADPCEDFYQFACGGWYEKHPVTNESAGTFYDASDLVQERLQLILESEPAPGDPAPLHDMRTHYATCLDTDTMDNIGLAPLWTQLSVQGGWPMVMDKWDKSSFVFEDALAHVYKLKVSPIISIATSSDFRNTSHKIIYVNEGQLGLDPSLLSDSDHHEQEIGYYKKYITDSAKLVRNCIGSSVDDDSISKEVDDMVNFEIAITDIMKFIPKNTSDVFAKTDVTGLQIVTDSDTSGEIDWMTLFRDMFIETDVVINDEEPLYVFREKYLTLLSSLFSKTPRRTVANYLGWWWTKTTGPETTYAMRNVSFAFDHDMYGKQSLPLRSQHCIDQTNFHMGFALSRAYIDEYFPPQAKGETTELVQLIREAFQSLLDENTWMDPSDIVVAKEKLDAIVDHDAYPDWIMDNALITLAFQGLEIKPGQQFNNLMRMADYYNYWNLETFRDEASKVYFMPPTVVNAFYDPFSNSITILAGILQPPFYLDNSLASLNFGGIGTIIGHEFTHGFDNNGRHFDKDGNFVNWWSRDTIDAFNERSKCFVNEYNAFYPPELAGTGYNMSVNGRQTLGENIADNGGVREAFAAYMSYIEKYGEEPRLPGLVEYTPNQLFFLGFSNVWCEHKTTQDLVNQLENDPHSPGRFRVIGSLSNDADFANTFNCPAGSPMNRGEDSCILW